MQKHLKSGQVTLPVFPLVIIIFLFICLIGTLGSYAIPSIMTEIAERQQLESPSHTYGFPPEWRAVDDYLYQTIHPGMTRDEVYEQLWRIAPFRVFPYATGPCSDKYEGKAREEEMVMPVTLGYSIIRRFCFDNSSHLIQAIRTYD